MSLSNREIAALIWLAIFLIAILFKKKIRDSAWAVIRAAFQPILVKVVLLMAIYTAGCVAILVRHQLWTLDNLKTTVLWFFTFAVVTGFERGASSKSENFIGDTMRETLAVTVFVEFLANAYSFGLLAELILLPIVTFMALMSAVAGGQAEHALVKKLLDFILAFVGFVYLFWSLYQAVIFFGDFATLANAREFLHPIALSLMFIPFLYLFHVYAVYQQVFVGIEFRIEDKRLRRYAKRRAILLFRTDTGFLQRWRRMVMVGDPQSRADIDAVFATLKRRKAVEANPPKIPPSSGWSPFAAQCFLASEGFKMDDYHAVHDGWMSSSAPVRLKRTVFDGSITYRIYGDEDAATRLTLELDMMTMEDSDAADAEFTRLMAQLMAEAMGPDLAERLVRGLDQTDDTFTASRGYWRVSLTRKHHDYNTGPAYERELIIWCIGIPPRS